MKRLTTLMLIACILPSLCFARVFYVGNTLDLPDDAPGDEVCRAAGLNGDEAGMCTLRAAVMEVNHLAASAEAANETFEIRILPGDYRLTASEVSDDDEDADHAGATNDLDLWASRIILRGTYADGSQVSAADRPRIFGNRGEALGHRVFHIVDNGIYMRTYEFWDLRIREGHARQPDRTGYGGGILCESAFQLVISRSELAKNEADQGGAAVASADCNVAIEHSRINENVSRGPRWSDAALRLVTYDRPVGVAIFRSSVTKNEGYSAIGTANWGDGTTRVTVAITASTIAWNQEMGISNEDGKIFVKGSTLWGNNQGIAQASYLPGQHFVECDNSIVSNNAAGDVRMLSGVFKSLGHNYIDTTVSDGGVVDLDDATDLVGQGLLELVVRNVNGYSTGLQPPDLFSPVRGKGDPDAGGVQPGDCLETDQAGRTRGPVCDIGALEAPIGLEPWPPIEPADKPPFDFADSFEG